MILILLTIGLIAVGLAIGLIVTAKAPFGYEDEAGFHFGLESGQGTMEMPGAASRRTPAQARFSPKPA